MSAEQSTEDLWKRLIDDVEKRLEEIFTAEGRIFHHCRFIVKELSDRGQRDALPAMMGHLARMIPPRDTICFLADAFETTAESILESRDWMIQVERLREISYRDYLLSDWWQSRRLRSLQLARGRCQVCNTAADLNVHHRTYENRGCEADEDLIVLCRSCHSLFHNNGKLAGPEA